MGPKVIIESTSTQQIHSMCIPIDKKQLRHSCGRTEDSGYA